MHAIFYIISLVQPMMTATRVTGLYQVQAQRISKHSCNRPQLNLRLVSRPHGLCLLELLFHLILANQYIQIPL